MPSSRILRQIYVQTYAVLFALALINFDLLGGFALPFFAGYYIKFIDFLLLPTGFAILGSAALTYVLCRVFPKIKRLVPLTANLIFLGFLFPSANLYKNHLIELQLVGHNPDCVEYGSFFDSAFKEKLNFRGHAMFEENGKVYLWSYSEQKFFDASPRLAKNFTCKNSRK